VQTWEPQLKYNQLECDASLILARDEATAFQASDKLHVLGCSSGHVHVLDFEGHAVRARAHSESPDSLQQGVQQCRPAFWRSSCTSLPRAHSCSRHTAWCSR
jgi:hypothetical protein